MVFKDFYNEVLTRLNVDKERRSDYFFLLRSFWRKGYSIERAVEEIAYVEKGKHELEALD